MDNVKKVVCIDIDGTLSVPRYRLDDGTFASCFPKEEWMAYCTAHGEDSYQYCKPVTDMQTLMRHLRNEGIPVFVISICETSGEMLAKTKFLHEEYADLYDEAWMVASEEDKVITALSLAQQYEVEAKDCVLIDDTFSTLMKAREMGTVSVHILDVLGGFFADLTGIV